MSLEETIARVVAETVERVLREHEPAIADAVAKRLGEQQGDKDLLDVNGAAKRSGVDADTVRKWISDGALRVRRTPGGKIRVAPADLERCLTPSAPRVVDDNNVEALAAALARKAAGNG